MGFLRRYRLPLIGFGVVLAVVSFLAFRPDKIFIDDVVDESLSEAFLRGTATTTTQPPASATAPTTIAPAAMPDPSEPAVIASGMFYGIDHSAAGTAAIYEQDGSYVLRFEDDTDIQNGPDLYVWVLAEPDFDGSEPSGFIDLGVIKGNVGGQNYELPPEFDPAVHRSVLIWCLRFGIPFAAAPLA